MSIRSKLNISVKIEPCFTADDWCLYTATKDCRDAAKALNEALRNSVNYNCTTRYETSEAMTKVMEEWSDYGAYDYEPCRFLDEILKIIYVY